MKSQRSVKLFQRKPWATTCVLEFRTRVCTRQNRAAGNLAIWWRWLWYAPTSDSSTLEEDSLCRQLNCNRCKGRWPLSRSLSAVAQIGELSEKWLSYVQSRDHTYQHCRKRHGSCQRIFFCSYLVPVRESDFFWFMKTRAARQELPLRRKPCSFTQQLSNM